MVFMEEWDRENKQGMRRRKKGGKREKVREHERAFVKRNKSRKEGETDVEGRETKTKKMMVGTKIEEIMRRVEAGGVY